MRLVFSGLLLLGFCCCNAQVGPGYNAGREYGNPKMPLMVSHLAGANKERLKRANKFTKHHFFNKILCFRKVCRIQSGHTKSLHAISFKKFKRKIAKNAKKGEYKNVGVDTAYKRKPPIREVKPVVIDTTRVSLPAPVKADTLIVLGAELLFETNKSELRSEHFGTLNSIIDYLLLNDKRKVRVSGHTDSSGREAHNLSLSKQRADVVAEFLVDNGVSIDRMETAGLGSSRPIADNNTEKGREKNRRVELLIHDD